MSEINYKAEVLKVWPDAIRKHVGIDNGHSTISRYAIFKIDSVLSEDLIGSPTMRKLDAWRSAYEHLKQQGKI